MRSFVYISLLAVFFMLVLLAISAVMHGKPMFSFGVQTPTDLAALLIMILVAIVVLLIWVIVGWLFDVLVDRPIRRMYKFIAAKIPFPERLRPELNIMPYVKTGIAVYLYSILWLFGLGRAINAANLWLIVPTAVFSVWGFVMQYEYYTMIKRRSLDPKENPEPA